ncbi:MAG: hypothetical protein ACE5IY_20050 [bacterium]
MLPRLLGSTFSVFLLLTVTCASSQKDRQNAREPGNYKKLALEKFGEDVQTYFNQSKTFVLCIKKDKTSSQNPFPPLRYFIFDLHRQEILHEESLPNGGVDWLNDYQIKITLIPGFITADERINKNLMGYIYDVKKRKKIRHPVGEPIQ